MPLLYSEVFRAFWSFENTLIRVLKSKDNKFKMESFMLSPVSLNQDLILNYSFGFPVNGILKSPSGISWSALEVVGLIYPCQLLKESDPVTPNPLCADTISWSLLSSAYKSLILYDSLELPSICKMGCF